MVDTLSHAVWGWVITRHRGPQSAVLGALAGALPDILWFVPTKIEALIEEGWSGLSSLCEPGIWRADGPPLPPSLAEAYADVYVWTHSLVVLGAVCGLAACTRARRHLWLAVPYAFHILIDVPTHERYRTPLLHPFSDFTFHGVSWGDPRVFFPHLVLLAVAVACVAWRHRRGKPLE
jgi:hypothetical protein